MQEVYCRYNTLLILEIEKIKKVSLCDQDYKQ